MQSRGAKASPPSRDGVGDDDLPRGGCATFMLLLDAGLRGVGPYTYLDAPDQSFYADIDAFLVGDD